MYGPNMKCTSHKFKKKKEFLQTHNIDQEKEIGQKKGEFFYPTFCLLYLGV